MTKDEWLAQARRDLPKIRLLVGSYHPVNLDRLRGLPITAPNAEMACEAVRQTVRKTFVGDSPIAQLEAALDKGEVGAAIRILDQTWFGVPESTQCWRLEGFRETVALLEDPPDAPEPDEDDL